MCYMYIFDNLKNLASGRRGKDPFVVPSPVFVSFFQHCVTHLFFAANVSRSTRFWYSLLFCAICCASLIDIFLRLKSSLIVPSNVVFWQSAIAGNLFCAVTKTIWLPLPVQETRLVYIFVYFLASFCGLW